MEVVSTIFGFFLQKEIENRGDFYHELKKELKLNLKEIFSVPESADLTKISAIPDFPLLEASNSKINLKISFKKIILEIKGQGSSNIKKFFETNNQIIINLIDFIQKENKIVRFGIISRIFLKKTSPVNYLKNYLNLKKFAKKKIENINLRVDYIEKVNNIKSNHLINLYLLKKEKKRKKSWGVGLNIDINNVEEYSLKDGEINIFVEDIKKKIIKLYQEKKNG